MSRGMTIAELVQKVFYAVYKVRLDVDVAADQSYHAGTDKFKEVVMEANMVLDEIQGQQDWNWLRDRLVLGTAEALDDGRIVEFQLDDDVFKVCTGFNDAVRLHHPTNPNLFFEVPFTSARNGTVNNVAMFDGRGRLNQPDNRLMAFMVGDHLTFTRPFTQDELGWIIETDIIKMMDQLHICDSTCTQPCHHAYEDKVFTQVPTPYYIVVRTAAKRAEGDPSASDRLLSLGDEAMKLLSIMRSADSAKTVPDTYTTSELGYTRIL
jgi:hypothetical protein